ncbi:hypothetical protein Cgig2_030615 [Carnegiea gigantea]|uniref:Uncharacterized protein n=1 Tax=Carnegiea gigantea TaxID=171969 RepID=A0A9Q1K8D0_9CARY|nr:hypothetical protein Cgig2_030615 [Carnegiea gigantea]
MGMIRLPVRFSDKIKSRSLEVDFLIVDVPTAYNVILGQQTLHKPARAHPQSEDRPRNNRHLETLWQGSAQPCRGTRGRRSGLAGSPAPGLGLHQPRPSPADAAALSFLSHGPPGPPAVFRSAVGTARRAPPAAGTPRQPSSLKRRPRPWLFLPRSPWGDEAPGVAKF